MRVVGVCEGLAAAIFPRRHEVRDLPGVLVRLIAQRPNNSITALWALVLAELELALECFDGDLEANDAT